MSTYRHLSWAFFALDGRFTGITPRLKGPADEHTPVSDVCLDAARDLAFTINRLCIQKLKPDSPDAECAQILVQADGAVAERFGALTSLLSREDVHAHPEFTRDRIFVVLAVAHRLRTAGFNLDSARPALQQAVSSGLRSSTSLLRVALMASLKAAVVKGGEPTAPPTPVKPDQEPGVDPRDLPSIQPGDLPIVIDPPPPPKRKPAPAHQDASNGELPAQSEVNAALLRTLQDGVAAERARGSDWVVRPITPSSKPSDLC